MSIYQFAPGHDNEAELEPLPIQPKSVEGVTFPRRLVAADMSAYDDGAATIELVYTGLSENEYPTILVFLGLDDVATPSVEGTFTLPSAPARVFTNFNGTIHRPERARYVMGIWRDIVFRVIALTEL